jgi:hypothetical protein
METTDSSLNPISAPAAETPLLLVELRQSARWMKFLSIVGFIFVGLAALGGLLMLAISRFGFIFTIVFFLFGLLGYFPVMFLFQYARGVQNHQQTGDMDELENAFHKQKAFWKYIGVIMIIYLVVILIGILTYIAKAQ